MTSVYILFLLAPMVQHLGEYPSLQECERVAQTISSARHKDNVVESTTFYANRLKCVKISKTL
jgi:hypothetical protein